MEKQGKDIIRDLKLINEHELRFGSSCVEIIKNEKGEIVEYRIIDVRLARLDNKKK